MLLTEDDDAVCYDHNFSKVTVIRNYSVHGPERLLGFSESS